MRILRHSKIAMTTEIYTEAPSDATRDALRRLGLACLVSSLPGNQVILINVSRNREAVSLHIVSTRSAAVLHGTGVG